MLGASPKAKKGATVKFGSMKNPPPPPVVGAAAGAAAAAAGGKVPAEEVWEVRPGGMLVQKRGGGADEEPVNVKPVPTIRVKVKHAGITHEIYINSQASFGELKKMVAARTGLHPDDQKVMYKDKERDSKAFLDMAGVKDRSKLVVVEDPEARARRLIEERRNGHLEKAAKAVAAVTAEVDKLAPKVAALDASVRKGEKVAENDVVQVTELLMNELLKLDAVVADGDVKAQRRLQVKRVQKYVETLDAVMAKNAAIVRKSGEKLTSKQHHHPPARQQQQQPPPARQQQQQQQQAHQHHQQPAAGQTRWEMFDLLSSLPSTSSASSTTTVSSTASSGAPPPLPPPANRLDWMLF
ncbi:BAG family molecular chaperone regulator 3-like [Oryza glaberrima]|uniref:BAG domain-containing protein n=1 Tax=Oryza glaberrima TaxID=4538 RepID=I1PZ47_ORYGL|nr:BAG family molecular chaperone regulator 3-like [Oryza glaberrima]